MSARSMTNGEAIDMAFLVSFLRWMRLECAPIPEAPEECEQLLARWLAHQRRGNAQITRRLARASKK